MKEKIILIGYESTEDFLIKFVAPVMGGSIVAFFVLLLFFTVPFYVPYIFLLIGILFVFGYPLIAYEQKRMKIQENLHLFITYAGTVSTLGVNRVMLFEKLSQNYKYGEISKLTERILYLAKTWNLGFASACRRITKFIPSKILADFFDRFAAVLDFGSSIETFLIDEQDSFLNDFEAEYKKSLENIKVMQDVFVSVTISLAFALSSALLMPLILGIPITVVIKYGFLAMLLADILLLLLVKSFIPEDRLAHKLKIKDKETLKARKWTLILLPISMCIFLFMMYLNTFSLIINLTVSLLPLGYVGYLGIQVEKIIFDRDLQYPAMIRAVGSSAYARGGGITSTLGALQVHNFGILQPMVTNLYRRLRLGSDKFTSWMYFCGETGSSLIQHFTEIFYESVYLGGNALKIGEIISKNFMRLIGLRKLRMQLASSIRGAMYGALVGFVSTMYMASSITGLLSTMFSNAFGADDVSASASELFANIIPQIPSVDFELVGLIISLMVIVHAVVSTLIIKFIDGGNYYAAMLDFLVLLIIGTVLSIAVPKLSSWAFGTLITGA